MKRIAAVVVLLGLTISLSLAGGSVSAQGDAGACSAVGGTFMLNFIDETTGLAALSGDLSGAVRGVIVEMTAHEDGSMSFTAEHVINTVSGDMLMTQDEATLTPVEEGVFYMVQNQTIVGGTGEFAGVTGSLEEFGVVNMSSGQGVLRYSGELCPGA